MGHFEMKKLLPFLVTCLFLSLSAFADDQNSGNSDQQPAITNAQREALRKQSQELQKSLNTLKVQDKKLQEMRQSVEQAQNKANESVARAAGEDIKQLPELEKRLGRDNPIVLEKYTTVGYHYFFSKQYKQADSLFTWLVVAREKTSGPNSHDTGQALLNLAETKRLEGLKADAKPLYERSIKILSTTRSPLPSIDAGTLEQAKRGLKLVE